ncbi:hypothetical protein COT75_04655 [Candidatus Beckwithbacteria bacterium CG10_big_fil_rev_8_21_14_0_10_34_10]|uniref:Glycoside hydrolase family 5 domain-containing protein n=1 Tax=Candidatus Beckwithbacteria bacterium CG10_big_fil_rev_8_21_14_0_10_34_10 TaxID=1974495 RepID=A0A2H0W7U1_9BACT|nr:MAG: hypothetical protein COT75_04655 [Candidatus Beckwithbacteria bacterium CG10_big_fil_rev_8_21_14_0_10_34_10]
MRKQKLIIITIFLFLFLNLFLSPAWASNNKIGIHILETTEVEEVAKLVNSTGGDWGYVTIVLRDDDLEKDKWQDFFNNCRKLHLIPIIRLATHPEDSYWAKPNPDNLGEYVGFLNSLNWPVKKQIVVFFNEPNHKKEWGGEINPQEYVLVSEKLITLFKQSSPNFYILPAGFDQSADGKNGTMKEEEFLQGMILQNPNVFSLFDAWNSHSYPNQGFVGLPTDNGRGTIKGYLWELSFLKNLGVEKDFGVFITETGWPHQEGEGRSAGYFNQEKTAVFYEQAFSIWQADDKVLAVTPFVLNHPAPPFDYFSFFKKDGSFYPQYEKILGISKVKGEVEQIKSFKVSSFELAEILPTKYEYQGKIKVKNTGQWIMGEDKDFSFLIDQERPYLNISSIKLSQGDLIYPNEEKEIDFLVKTGTQSAEHRLKMGEIKKTIYVFKPFDFKNKKVNIFQQILTKIKLFLFDL